jgi:hypothetical protein
MKKNIILIVSLVLLSCSALLAQIAEGTACTAICMDPTKSSITGRQPNQNNVSPNQNLPCGGGTSEDNPMWWVLRPSGTNLTFQVIATNCVAGECGIGVQTTIWEGDACGNVTSLGCKVGLSEILTVPTTPCKVYYLQIDGLCECRCDIKVSYDKNQLLSKVDKATITGASQICKGASTVYTASIPTMQGCRPDSWKWTVIPANAGTISAAVGSDDATFKFNGTVPDSVKKIMICVEPVFKGKCPPITQKQCMEVDITGLKPATCDVTLCADERPKSYRLIDCIKTINTAFNAPISPEYFIIASNYLPGTITTTKINYIGTDTGCKGEVNLNIKIKNNSDSSCICPKTAGVMKTKFIITAKLNKSIKVTHQNTIAAGLAFAYVLHEGNAGVIINPLVTNQTGIFNFDDTKMKCNKVYYVSYMVAKSLNGMPDLSDRCLDVTKGQPIAWLCPIKAPVAAAREDNQDISLSENAETAVAIYPNPTDDKFFIELPTLKSTPSLDLFDMQGKKVLSQNDMTQYDASHYEVQVSDLPKGIYVLKMNLDGKPAVQKIIVE